MSNNQDGIDELMRRMRLLLDQQATFSKEIDILKVKVEEISAKEISNVKIADNASDNEKPISVAQETPDQWSDSVSLNTIKKEITTHEEGLTKSGKAFIKFRFVRKDKVYVALIATTSNWAVQTESGDLIARGKFTNNGLTAKSLQGGLVNQVVKENSVVDTLVKAAGLDTIASPPRIERIVSKPIPPRSKSAIEKYIGENLIAVIAAIIILIGVVFGVKYSIDRDLISPLGRVLLSYLLGIGILGVGMKLKKKYEQFSAILVSTSMAIMYFTTFGAYSFYALMPKLATFGIMVLFTIFTVVAAINYNREIIAHIGLVGSYAVPFLLSDGSGNVAVLFVYMAIINAGILILGFKRHWKSLYYVSFAATWLIYSAWFLKDYNNDEYFYIATLFAALYFVMFYVTFLAYKLVEKEKFAPEDILMIVLNSAVFYGFSYACLDQNATGKDYVGLFTLATAIIHFVVSVIIFKTKLADRNLFYLSSGLVLVFITIAIPVQLDGTWVTLLWAGEAVVLFWIGRTKSVLIYERLSYPVMVITLFSLGNDWLEYYPETWRYLNSDNIQDTRRPFLNIAFLTSVMVIISFAAIQYFNKIEEHRQHLAKKNEGLLTFLSFSIPTAIIVLTYLALYLDLNLYWQQQYTSTAISIDYVDAWGNSASKDYFNSDILKFRVVWLINFTILFLSALTFLNLKKIKSETLGKVNLFLNSFGILMVLILGLYQLSELRESYILEPNSDKFEYSAFNIGLRYISYALLALIMYLTHRVTKDLQLFKIKINVITELVLHTIILWILSSELINILDLSGSDKQHKLGLSILAALYAFVMVGLGIKNKKQHLRIAAFSLFGIVLIKLFLYDIVRLTTIAKTIVFISLGIILLVVSFMYNKFKDQINDKD